jgi:uncharacterized membrane protein
MKMDKMFVIVFDSEAQAYEGSKALLELQDEGSISLYAQAVIVRDASGKLDVKQQSDVGPVGTVVGLVTGSLIGLIGGPLGLAIGAGAGTFGGVVYDLSNLRVNQDFLIEVEKSLQPGKAAVVAEVFEEWTTPIDTRMESLGGIVIRRTRRDMLDEQVEKEIRELNKD